ncbi:sperm-associated microtubule inner protein 4 [Neosynchiropus ocellatus]
MGEKTIKVAFPKEHPYASHISRFAMFPSFKSPDDPDSGVTASSQPFLGSHAPKAAPEVSVLSKSIGGPYRLEVLESAAGRRDDALTWPGDRGFWDYAKPMREESQVWYPTPPKTVLPNPKLRDWEGTLSERTGNMLKNLEKALWITSYQMHYTGSGPAGPLQMDDFREQISDPSGTSSHAAPLEPPLKSGLLPRAPVLPGIQQLGRTNSPDPEPLLQSFSKSEAHRRFNVSIARPLVNLNDNVVTGRKHDFYGVNCNLLH